VLERSGLLPVAGAEVVLIRDDLRLRAIFGSVSTVTDVSGRYSFDSLAPGRYRVDVRKAGYAAPIGAAPQVTVAAGKQRTSVN